MNTPPLQPDKDYKEIAEIIYGVDEAEKLIKAKAHLPQVEAVFRVLEAREQAARIDERQGFESIAFNACDEANLSAPDKRAVMESVRMLLSAAGRIEE